MPLKSISIKKSGLTFKYLCICPFNFFQTYNINWLRHFLHKWGDTQALVEHILTTLVCKRLVNKTNALSVNSLGCLTTIFSSAVGLLLRFEVCLSLVNSKRTPFIPPQTRLLARVNLILFSTASSEYFCANFALGIETASYPCPHSTAVSQVAVICLPRTIVGKHSWMNVWLKRKRKHPSLLVNARSDSSTYPRISAVERM